VSDQGGSQPGLRIGRIFGIPVFLGPSWFLIAALLTVVYQPAVLDRVDGISPGAAYVVSFSFAVLLYMSVLVHELGHSLVARAFQLPVQRITIQALVGLSHIEREPPTPARELLVAAAGPLTSVALGAIGWGIFPLLTRGSVMRVIVEGLAVSNGVVGALNLLPGLPLDGGRVLRALIWRINGNPTTATIWAGQAGRVVGLAIGFGGVALSWGPRATASTYNVLLFAVVGAFIWSGATATVRAARLGQRVPALRARGLTRRSVQVSAEVPLAEALRQLNESAAGGIVVVDGAGHPTAVVSEAAVSAVPEQRRPWVNVASVARGLQDGMTLAADLEGSDLLDAMRRAPAPEYVVVETDGQVYGVLVAGDVATAISAGR
jgi:Zn-dependent protease/CBS domain-containing protein